MAGHFHLLQVEHDQVVRLDVVSDLVDDWNEVQLRLVIEALLKL